MTQESAFIDRLLWRFRQQNRGQAQAFLPQCAMSLLDDSWGLLPPQPHAHIAQLGGENLCRAHPWPHAKMWHIPLDEEHPPFADSVLHAVVWHLSMARVNNVLSTLRAWRKTLRKGGVFVATTWGASTLQELRFCLRTAETELTGGLAPRFMPVFDVKDAGRLLQTVGFSNVTAAAHSCQVLYKNPQQLIADLRAAGETCTLHAGTVPLKRAVWRYALQLYNTHYTTTEGAYIATFDTVVMVGHNGTM